MTYKRRRGAAIVQTPKGILLVNERGRFILPGGGAREGESRESAAVRELKEETLLEPIGSKFLFKYKGVKKKLRRGGMFRDYTKVFKVVTKGVPKASGEVDVLGYYNTKSKDKLSLDTDTRRILERLY
jgi:ADP-ribose pyrophosphatase YjhB (NUDIX family)